MTGKAKPNVTRTKGSHRTKVQAPAPLDVFVSLSSLSNSVVMGCKETQIPKQRRCNTGNRQAWFATAISNIIQVAVGNPVQVG